MPVLAPITRVISSLHFALAGSKSFQSNSWKKNLRGWKARVYETIWYKNLRRNHTILNDIDSTSCFQGNNLHPRVTGFMHAFRYIFFSFWLISSISPVQELRTIIPLNRDPSRVLGMRARLFAWSRAFMPYVECTMQNWIWVPGNSPKNATRCHS